MTPRKSISFAVGIGAEARMGGSFSPCQSCDMRNCAYRRAPRRLDHRPAWATEIGPLLLNPAQGKLIGACLELTERYRPPMPLRIRLQAEAGPIEVEAQVVWAREPTLSRGGTLHGVVFTHVAPDQRRALHDLIVIKGHARQAGVRLPLDLPVTCQSKSQPAASLQGRTGNLSRKGLLLHLPQSLPAGTELALTLHAPTGPLTAEGAIVWVEPPEERTSGELVQHGCRLTALGWSTSLSLGLLLAEPA